MQDIYILGSVRTAIGAFGGSLQDVEAVELGTAVIKNTCERAGVGMEQVSQVLMGNVLQAGLGQNPARQAAMRAGIPQEIPAMTINKVCGSGLNAVNLAAALIRAGMAECVVAGGMENMSRAPHTMSLRRGQKMGSVQATDSLIHEGLWDAFYDYHMGVTAENVAKQYGVTREMQDTFALQSQQKALRAIQTGRFRDEIVPIPVLQKKGEAVLFAQDEYVRDTSAEALAKLRPAFEKDGTVTAGNASGINDGAAAMVVASGDFVKKHNLMPQAKWLGCASCGVDPQVMGTGPIPTVKQALQNTGLVIGDMDLIEANEAFASQAIAVMRGIGADEEKTNVNGGAIALGHPIGASGARIAVTLLHELAKREAKYGLATLCIGGGMGEAAIFERDALCR
ncbi:MAG: acetyl-CoA C-acetyltransferase [Christensenella sp.]|uniref:acetyl-CoA C-acetyltransferase n=1 Tax=Christensenella sp. TaxID=1935934 RepID=UPI002B1FD5D4|nr:acetyl-CoA C-acetyltransferase [Christensenella sp.]MEA5003522.1 acetyl-CoA C-acetyltransferase [Christensenella sp.]